MKLKPFGNECKCSTHWTAQGGKLKNMYQLQQEISQINKNLDDSRL